MVDETRFARDGITYTVDEKDADGRYVPVSADGRRLGGNFGENQNGADANGKIPGGDAPAQPAADMAVEELNETADGVQNPAENSVEHLSANE